MFVLLEGEVLVNMDLVEKVELHHSKKTATLWAGGMNLHADSRAAYKLFVPKEGKLNEVFPHNHGDEVGVIIQSGQEEKPAA
jgi:hypothetical protein